MNRLFIYGLHVIYEHQNEEEKCRQANFYRQARMREELK